MASMKAHLRLEHQFIEHFKRHSAMTEQQIRDIMFAPSDRWLSPTECKKLGLVDVIVDELPEPGEYPTARLAAAPAPQSSARSRRRRKK
jgi:ATP-dependent protease ClpP protease subunit